MRCVVLEVKGKSDRGQTEYYVYCDGILKTMLWKGQSAVLKIDESEHRIYCEAFCPKEKKATLGAFPRKVSDFVAIPCGKQNAEMLVEEEPERLRLVLSGMFDGV